MVIKDAAINTQTGILMKIAELNEDRLIREQTKDAEERIRRIISPC